MTTLETIRALLSDKVGDENRIDNPYHQGRVSAFKFCLELLKELKENIAGLEAELRACKADRERLEAELDQWIQRAPEFKPNVTSAYNSIAAAQRLRWRPERRPGDTQGEATCEKLQ